MITVSPQDIADRLDVAFAGNVETRVSLLIDDAVELIHTAFLKAGRDLEADLGRIVWLPAEARRVVREMVSAAIIVGPNAGVRSVSSTTGQESDTITYADVNAVSFGGVLLTDAMREALGLPMGGLPRGSFPPAPHWPEWISR